MRIILKPLLASFAVSMLIGGCAITPHTEKLKYEPLQKRVETFVPESTSTYVREVTQDEVNLNQKVSLVGVVALIDALRLKLPNLSVIPKDSNVNLTKNISVSAKNMPVKDYLEYLSSLSAHEISLTEGKIEVRSFVRKKWNLGMFASKRNVNLKVGTTFDSSSGGSEGSERNNTVATTFNDDEWSTIIEGAERILNVKKSNKTKNGSGRISPYVQAVRSVGTIHAGGSPQRMKAVDDFITAIEKSGSRQINISVKAFDVKLNDNRGAGIDWSQLSLTNKINGNPIDFAFNSVANGVTTANNTLFQGRTKFSSDHVTADMFLNFLSQFGEVELLNQPNVTVRNGSYAYIATGEEMHYVAKINQLTSSEVVEEGSPVITLKTERELAALRVGVTLAVTPRILSDGRILLDIWPVVTSVERFDTFGEGIDAVEAPHVELQELSTQVIAESGKPIQLGGFIRRSIEKSLQELPWHEKLSGAILNPIFKSEAQGVERRELVLTVTSTIIEGA